MLTKGITIADFGPPASNEMDFVLGHVRHLRVPLSNQFNVFVHLVGLDLVEDDAVDVLSSREDLAETALDLLVHFSAFLSAVDQVREAIATSLLGVLLILDVVLA